MDSKFRAKLVKVVKGNQVSLAARTTTTATFTATVLFLLQVVL